MAYPQIESDHFTLGKGEMMFQSGETYSGEFRSLGNAPSFNISVEIEKLEHYDSRAGARSKDDEIITQKKAKGTITIDEVNMENQKMWLLGGDMTETEQAAAVGTTAEIAEAALDKWQYIQSALSVRYYNISNLVVKDSTDTTTYVLDTDYEADLEAGIIRALSSGSISEDDELHLTFDTAELDHYRFYGLVADEIKGHIYFKGKPPKGKIQDLVGYVSLTPSGDLPEIGEEWKQLQFDVEFLDHSQYGGEPFERIERGNKVPTAT